jgi:hypothetical protein
MTFNLILQNLMTGLWVLLYAGLAVIFVAKYQASPTGLLGAIGSAAHILIVVAYAVVPRVMAGQEGRHIGEVFTVLNFLGWSASVCMVLAVLLAPVPRPSGTGLPKGM